MYFIYIYDRTDTGPLRSQCFSCILLVTIQIFLCVRACVFVCRGLGEPAVNPFWTSQSAWTSPVHSFSVVITVYVAAARARGGKQLFLVSDWGFGCQW